MDTRDLEKYSASGKLPFISEQPLFAKLAAGKATKFDFVYAASRPVEHLSVSPPFEF